jgi:hypothetical protein
MVFGPGEEVVGLSLLVVGARLRANGRRWLAIDVWRAQENAAANQLEREALRASNRLAVRPHTTDKPL